MRQKCSRYELSQWTNSNTNQHEYSVNTLNIRMPWLLINNWILVEKKPWPILLRTAEPKNYWIKESNMVFHAFTFARSRGRCWKPRPKAAVFNTSQGTWRMLMHWKTMFDRYYCIKTENFCYISRYFLHFFVSPFPRCRANAICMDYARSRARQYTSRDGSNSVAPVRAHWKLRSAWIAWLIHGFSPVNARLLITYCFLCNNEFWIA